MCDFKSRLYVISTFISFLQLLSETRDTMFLWGWFTADSRLQNKVTEENRFIPQWTEILRFLCLYVDPAYYREGNTLALIYAIFFNCIEKQCFYDDHEMWKQTLHLTCCYQEVNCEARESAAGFNSVRSCYRTSVNVFSVCAPRTTALIIIIIVCFMSAVRRSRSLVTQKIVSQVVPSQIKQTNKQTIWRHERCAVYRRVWVYAECAKCTSAV